MMEDIDRSEGLAPSKASHRSKGKLRVTRVHRLHEVKNRRRTPQSGKIICISAREMTGSVPSKTSDAVDPVQNLLSFSSILTNRYRQDKDNQSSLNQHSTENPSKNTINSSNINSNEKRSRPVNRQDQLSSSSGNHTYKLSDRFRVKSPKVFPNPNIPLEQIMQISNHSGPTTTKNQPSNTQDFMREHLNFSKRNQKKNTKKKHRRSYCCLPPRLFILVSIFALLLLGIAISAIMVGVLTKTKTSTTITTTLTTETTTTVVTTTSISTTTTYINCGTTCVDTVVSTLSRVAFFSFDNVTTDATGSYPAGGIASPIYVSGWVGQAISFVYANAQFLSTAHIPLSYRSFTIELWFYATDLSSTWDYSLAGEQQTATNDQCLFINIRGSVLCFGFYNDDTAGITTIVTNRWYHAAFLYDNVTQTQSIYLNGLLERTTSVNPFQATSGNFTIGGAYVGGSTALVVNYTGYIDHLTISARAKSACEIYLDATLACYFTFDLISSLSDSGPNFLTAINTNAVSNSGRVNQAMQFATTLSYILIQGIQALTASNTAFTISMWVNPTSLLGGATLIHASTKSNGQGVCLAQWGLTTAGFLTVNVVNSANNTFSATTSFSLPLNTWTHIAQTFSTTNGNSLYVNGTLITTVSAATAGPVGPYIFLGASPANTGSCIAGPITMGQFYGSIDEYRVFGQRLSVADICRLAYP